MKNNSNLIYRAKTQTTDLNCLLLVTKTKAKKKNQQQNPLNL